LTRRKNLTGGGGRNSAQKGLREGVFWEDLIERGNLHEGLGKILRPYIGLRKGRLSRSTIWEQSQAQPGKQRFQGERETAQEIE